MHYDDRLNLKTNRSRMFQEAFEKLELEDVAMILEALNPALDGTEFDPIETTILALNLPFYKGYQILDVADNTEMPPRRRFAVYKKPDEIHVLNFTNEPIYALNEAVPIKLSEKNIDDYVRFFFTYVRGKHGRFILAENVDDIQWKEDPPPSARKAIGNMVMPVTLIGQDSDGTYNLQATMTFKNSLFKSDIDVKSNGQISLKNEELLVDDMPVMDDRFGQ